MLVLRFVLMALMLVALGAHYLRAFVLPFVLISALMLALMWIPRRWTVFPVQLWLLLGSAQWLAATLQGVRARAAEGKPFLRMAIILATVGALTLVAALLPFFGRMRAYYDRRHRERLRAHKAAPEAP